MEKDTGERGEGEMYSAYACMYDIDLEQDGCKCERYGLLAISHGLTETRGMADSQLADNGKTSGLSTCLAYVMKTGHGPAACICSPIRQSAFGRIS